MHRLLSTIVILFFSLSSINAQQLSLISVPESTIQETSGLIYLEGRLITHNDSGGQPMLYEMDSVSGSVTRSVFIENATNIDWEDICFDSTYIYIGDFGNNAGSRTDLKVYRLAIDDYLNTPNDSVTVDAIDFSYANQIDFTPSSFTTNFDAEALIAMDDSLYLFTKNWGNNKTSIYALSKTPGVYQLNPIDSIDVQGLITGATYDDSSHMVLLSGNTFASPFVVEISAFVNAEFSNGSINRYNITPPSAHSIQIESITRVSADIYYLTAEQSFNGYPSLYKLNRSISNLAEVRLSAVQVYPNPSSTNIQIEGVPFASMELYDAMGKLQLVTSQETINVAPFKAGTYYLKGIDSAGECLFVERLVINE